MAAARCLSHLFNIFRTSFFDTFCSTSHALYRCRAVDILCVYMWSRFRYLFVRPAVFVLKGMAAPVHITMYLLLSSRRSSSSSSSASDSDGSIRRCGCSGCSGHDATYHVRESGSAINYVACTVDGRSCRVFWDDGGGFDIALRLRG